MVAFSNRGIEATSSGTSDDASISSSSSLPPSSSPSLSQPQILIISIVIPIFVVIIVAALIQKVISRQNRARHGPYSDPERDIRRHRDWYDGRSVRALPGRQPQRKLRKRGDSRRLQRPGLEDPPAYSAKNSASMGGYGGAMGAVAMTNTMSIGGTIGGRGGRGGGGGGGG